MDDIKPTGENLQSVNKPVDEEEERLYKELYMQAIATT